MQDTNTPTPPESFLQKREKISKKFFPMQLPNGIRAELVESSAASAFISSNMGVAFPDRPVRYEVPPEQEHAMQILKTHLAPAHSEHVLFIEGETRVGWSVGQSQNTISYYMMNTGFLVEHRNKGTYTAFLPKFLEYLTELGYERVISRHKPDNPAVLIPKIRAGFFISALEFDEQFGTLVRLVYYTQGYRKQAFKNLVK